MERKYASATSNRKAQYPWDAWFSKGKFTVVQGKDFDCTLPGMTINVRSQARIRGLRVRIDQKPDRLKVTVKDE